MSEGVPISAQLWVLESVFFANDHVPSNKGSSNILWMMAGATPDTGLIFCSLDEKFQEIIGSADKPRIWIDTRRTPHYC